jgi:4-alpha-glucanotransferase
MKTFKFKRQGGILLHPTSLPGRQGIGTLGREAKDFLDFACQSGIKLWQVCPLNPTGYGDSPYQCFSAVAGNPLLIDLEELVRQGLLAPSDLAPFAKLPQDRVDFGALIPHKWTAIGKAYENFAKLGTKTDPAAKSMVARFEAFRRGERDWLPDFALFMACKAEFGGVSWDNWPASIKNREHGAMAEYRQKLAKAIQLQEFAQWLFFSQWNELRALARDRAIHIMGDMPIFVAYDSVDVWTRRELFQLAADGRPTAVAGVPPDYFSPTGQLWGNPLYNWEAMEAEGYQWWIDIIKHKLRLFDYLRIDHFRGFAAYWSVPFGNPTAEHGKWIHAPGKKLFTAVMDAIGQAPIIAEDLGLITPDVIELIQHFGFPGMKVLQFAFDSGEGNDHVPHNYVPNSVVYTGTHDNDTVLGWFKGAKEGDRQFTRDYLVLQGPEKTLHWEFIRAAFATVANIAVIPMQDILGLGSEARMNRPGVLGGNWSWRYQKGELKPAISQKLRQLVTRYSRW